MLCFHRRPICPRVRPSRRSLSRPLSAINERVTYTPRAGRAGLSSFPHRLTATDLAAFNFSCSCHRAREHGADPKPGAQVARPGPGAPKPVLARELAAEPRVHALSARGAVVAGRAWNRDRGQAGGESRAAPSGRLGRGGHRAWDGPGQGRVSAPERFAHGDRARGGGWRRWPDEPILLAACLLWGFGCRSVAHWTVVGLRISLADTARVMVVCRRMGGVLPAHASVNYSYTFRPSERGRRLEFEGVSQRAGGDSCLDRSGARCGRIRSHSRV